MIGKKKYKAKNITYSSWEEWNAKAYLQTYFSKLGPDSYKSLKFIIRELEEYCTKPVKKILDFGAGPTIFGAVAASPYTSEIHITDYLETNLTEIDKWLKNKRGSFNWNPCIKYILEAEGTLPNRKNINERVKDLRKDVKNLMRCDASLSEPLGEGSYKYPVVLTIFCPDSATSSKDIWKIYMKNISSLVEPGGMLLMASLRNCSFYKNGNDFFPCANINEEDIAEVLKENGFLRDKSLIEIFEVPECQPEGFTGIMCSRAIKRI